LDLNLPWVVGVVKKKKRTARDPYPCLEKSNFGSERPRMPTSWDLVPLQGDIGARGGGASENKALAPGRTTLNGGGK
jgi:hypothetical protein